MCEIDFGLVEDFRISSSEELLESSDTLKHKVVYIAEIIVHKCGAAAAPDIGTITNEFVEELKRVGS